MYCSQRSFRYNALIMADLWNGSVSTIKQSMSALFATKAQTKQFLDSVRVDKKRGKSWGEFRTKSLFLFVKKYNITPSKNKYK